MTPNRPYRFALVTHSKEVIEAVSQCIDPASEHLATELVDLDLALPTAQRLLEQGCEVVLGHGGTGATIAQSLGQQVVNIPTTALEVLHALVKAREIAARVAITSFAGPPDGLELLESLLGLTIRPIVYRSNRELAQGIDAALAAGFTVIVGGGVSRGLVPAGRGQVVLIEPNLKLVRQALVQARAIAAGRRREVEYAEQLKTTLHIIADGLVGVDNFGRLNFFNPAAEEILKADLQSVRGQSLSRVTRELGLIDVLAGGKAQIEEIRRIDGKDLVVNSLPIQIDGRAKGAVALFREAHAIHSIDRKLRERLYLRGFVARYTERDIKGESAQMRLLLQKAGKYARTDATVLIQGETGTGKELLAHALHHASGRSEKPFVAFNCSAIPENLLETELFGYEEGAFTGAKRGGKIGLFELAHHGTIFLDEIADISPALQVRLLRVLEAKEVMRVGGDRILPVDVRVIASAHRDLRREVQADRFRADLYFRLAMLRLAIPPLRERPEDIPAIAAEALGRRGRGLDCLSDRMRAALRSYRWPGNVRELLAVLESYLLLIGDGAPDEALFAQVMEEIRWDGERGGEGRADGVPGGKEAGPAVSAGQGSLKRQLAEFEKELIERTLRESRYDRTLAAKSLGVSPSTLWRRRNRDPQR